MAFGTVEEARRISRVMRLDVLGRGHDGVFEMSKYGNKFTCWSCSAKFYDLGKPNVKCPKCGADPAADPNAGGAAPAPELGDLDEEIETPDFSDDEESDDLEDAEEAEPEEEEEGF